MRWGLRNEVDTSFPKRSSVPRYCDSTKNLAQCKFLFLITPRTLWCIGPVSYVVFWFFSNLKHLWNSSRKFITLAFGLYSKCKQLLWEPDPTSYLSSTSQLPNTSLPPRHFPNSLHFFPGDFNWQSPWSKPLTWHCSWIVIFRLTARFMAVFTWWSRKGLWSF